MIHDLAEAVVIVMIWRNESPEDTLSTTGQECRTVVQVTVDRVSTLSAENGPNLRGSVTSLAQL